MALLVTPACLLYEDDHLLVVNKPPNLNTHSPDAWAGDGLYEWLRHRHLRWSRLAIIHRLDKATSGVLIFAKSQLARSSLTQQFARREVGKKYLFLTDRAVQKPSCSVRSVLVRAGSKYISRPEQGQDDLAITHFERLPETPILRLGPAFPLHPSGPLTALEAVPVTGRTHQVRVHAAQLGWPVLGDVLYGGTAAPRVFLHALSVTVRHPETGEMLTFEAAPEFSRPPWLALRWALLGGTSTDTCRWIHGAADGWPGFYVDQLGSYLLAQTNQPLTAPQKELLNAWPPMACPPATGEPDSPLPRGIYHKPLTRHVRQGRPADLSPRHWSGQAVPPRFLVRENGLFFEMSMGEGYSVGLFLDQRDNRRRLLVNHVAADFPVRPGGLADRPVLNTFAYTCGFSVCAAQAGAHTTSLDLSRKYLDWGRRNFLHNALNPDRHEFVCGDVFDWVRRWARKGRRFDVILLDPPTFSQSKQSGLFRADRDYAKLVRAVLPLLGAGGVLFASTNAAQFSPEEFCGTLATVVSQAGRRIRRQHYAPQPPDFPLSPSEPAYLKTVWLCVD